MREARVFAIADRDVVAVVHDVGGGIGERVTVHVEMQLVAAETVVGLTDVFKPFPERRGLYRPNAPSMASGRMLGLGAGTMKSAAIAGL